MLAFPFLARKCFRLTTLPHSPDFFRTWEMAVPCKEWPVSTLQGLKLYLSDNYESLFYFLLKLKMSLYATPFSPWVFVSWGGDIHKMWHFWHLYWCYFDLYILKTWSFVRVCRLFISTVCIVIGSIKSILFCILRLIYTSALKLRCRVSMTWIDLFVFVFKLPTFSCLFSSRSAR